jgi:arginine/lysine/ornithine decarboxylase
MNKSLQAKAPLMEALDNIRSQRIVPFDVPGHKRGRGNKELTEFLGKQCISVDVNSMKPLDNLCHPVSVIKEAEELAADAFGAATAFFMVGGTTSSVQAMILSCVKEGEKIIMPRNVHRSVINSLILCGAVPIYIDPKINQKLGISLGMSIEDVTDIISKNPDAKAVFVNNPTYYGVCSNLKAIVALAHKFNMKVLVDEAHGTHFYFNDKLPISAMEAGADMSSVSMHKSGGSLTQSSLLLMNKDINADYVRQIVNLTQTTSGSYLLMSSLDISRKRLAFSGESIFDTVLEMTSYAREEINLINGLYAFGKELIDNNAFFDFDETKLSINTFSSGLAGIEVYDILRDEYDIQIEFGDVSNILAYISVGDNYKNIERLIGALQEIVDDNKKSNVGMIKQEYISPEVVMPPRIAFYSNKSKKLLKDSIGKVSAEFVTCYPPGIPVLAPGELITKDIIDYIIYVKEKGCLLTGTEDINLKTINTISNGGK